ncbi:MAG: AAA family ATPase [Vulcanimicrobiaceae bacterium]
MLQRVIGIKNVGRFQNCAAAGDVTLRRYNLMFAENGRGKTTLCAILRSLCTNDPAIILGRKTLGHPDAPRVELLLGTGNVTFQNGSWSAAFPDMAIFDGTFVNENVFAGDIVDTEQRRNLYRIIIGAPGVTLARSVNDLDNQIRSKGAEIRGNRTAIQRFASPGMTVETFIALPEDAAIDENIQAKEQELAAVQRAAVLQQRPGLTAVAILSLPASLAESLAKTLPSVAADAERRVSEHVARHRMRMRGEAWLSEGLDYVTDTTCPFCDQDLQGVDLVQAYKDFFGAEYHALRDEVKGLTSQIDSALGEAVASEIEHVLAQNGSAVEFWTQYSVFEPPSLPEVGRVSGLLAAIRQAAQSLLQKKSGAPLEAVAPGEDFTHALQAFEALFESIAGYNANVAAVNAAIDATRRETRIANVRDVEEIVAKLKAQKARHTAEVRELCELDARLQREKTNLDAEKARTREQLDAHTQHVIADYGQNINRYLERINAGFRITTPTHNYRGGTPSSSYQILINQTPVDLGDEATPLDRPSFKNTLSAGDKSTLALAFFLAQLEQDEDRARKVVVFDDPFSSLDSFRRNQTVHQIYRSGETCAQVVLLSHEPQFLKLLWDRVATADRKTLQLARIGEENTTIVEWDIEKALQARYRADIDALQRFFSSAEGESREIIQKLRPVLEGYCRNLYPPQFSDQDTLGVIVGKIRAGGVGHPLSEIADDLDEVNLFCRRYHHADNPGAATEPIDDAELRGYVGRTLRLVGCSL